MQLIFQFFRLIRLSNILVMVLTMCLFYSLLSNYHFSPIQIDRQLSFISQSFTSPSFLQTLGLKDVSFLLLMLSVSLIAAAGNIINDYFDVKADRVNKPDRLIIDKYIKRRWAIILNWTLNGMGLLIATLISYRLQNWWIFGVSFLAINLLYFYSAIYKRKFLTGNLIIAFLTALVPFYVFIYGGFSIFGISRPFETDNTLFIQDNYIVIIGYSSFAFLLNFIREIAKDMADVKGDLLLGSKTLPIRLGFAKTKGLIIVLELIGILSLSWYIINMVVIKSVELNSDRIIFLLLLALVIFFLLVSLILLIGRNQKKRYLSASTSMKIAMLFGVISALFYV